MDTKDSSQELRIMEKMNNTDAPIEVAEQFVNLEDEFGLDIVQFANDQVTVFDEDNDDAWITGFEEVPQ